MPTPATIAAALRTAGLTVPSSRSLLIAAGYMTRCGLNDEPWQWAVGISNLQYTDGLGPEFTDPETRHTLLLICHAARWGNAIVNAVLRAELNATTATFAKAQRRAA